MYFPGTYIKKNCVKFVLFQASNGRWEVNRRKIICRAILYILLLFMRSYNSSYTRRNFDWEYLQIYSFSIVVRLLKSQIWSKLVNISGVLGTVWYGNHILFSVFICWTVLSTSSIWQQHLSVHSCKRRTRTRMRKVRKQANVHSTIILTFLFCPSRIYMWIFVCFWMWHSIRSCTYARFVTRGTL